MFRTLFIVVVIFAGCQSQQDLPSHPSATGNASENATSIEFDHRIADGSTGVPSYAEQKQFFVELPDKPVGPIWSSDAGNPPLPAANAIRLAIEQRNRLVGDTEDLVWSLESASIVPWQYETGFWYWHITFDLNPRPGRGGTGIPARFDVIVLMDGTVLQPTIKDYPD